MNTSLFTPRFLVFLFALLSLNFLTLVALGQVEQRGQTVQEIQESAPSLDAILLKGAEMHESLNERGLDSIRHLPPGMQLPNNPHMSTDDDFVQAVAGGGSQGRLDREGIVKALYGIYNDGQEDLGIYGLEAASDEAADKREKAIRKIWAHNGSFDRTRVYRQGRILVVIWHDEVSAQCWHAVNEKVKERLGIPNEAGK